MVFIFCCYALKPNLKTGHEGSWRGELAIVNTIDQRVARTVLIAITNFRIEPRILRHGEQVLRRDIDPELFKRALGQILYARRRYRITDADIL